MTHEQSEEILTQLVKHSEERAGRYAHAYALGVVWAILDDKQKMSLSERTKVVPGEDTLF